MRVACPVVMAQTGSDVYYQRLAAAMKPRGIHVDIIPLTYKNEFLPFTNQKIKTQLSSYDVIHTNIDYALLFKVAGVPLISTCHHNVFDSNYQKDVSIAQKIYHQLLLKGRIRESLKLSSRVVCVSDATYASFSNTFKLENSLVIHNGIDLSHFRRIPGIQKENNKIVLVGSVSRRKGKMFINNLMNSLPENINFVLVTRTHPGIELDKRINIVVNPTEEALVRIYNEAGIVISLSKIEGFGYTIVEGMACGCAVVAWNHSSIKEVCVQGQSGSLITPYDINEFAGSVINISNNKELIAVQSRFNIERVANLYSLDNMAEKYETLYREVINA